MNNSDMASLLAELDIVRLDVINKLTQGAKYGNGEEVMRKIMRECAEKLK